MNLLILLMNKTEREANTKRYNQIALIVLVGAALFLVLMYLAFEFKFFPPQSWIDDTAGENASILKK